MESRLGKLPQGYYIFIWGGLLKDAGGMTRVMLDRLCRFKRNGISVTVLLGGRGKEQYEAVTVYQQAGYPEIEKGDFLCMEDWLAERLTTDEEVASVKRDEGLFLCEKIENAQDVYSDGILSEKRYYDNFENLIKVENYLIASGEKKKVESVEFYYQNKRNKKVHYINDIEKYECYYAENGFCYMACYYYEGKEKKVKLFNQKNGSVCEYASISDVREYFYSQYVMEHYTQDMFVFCDPILDLEPGFRYMVEDAEHRIYKIAINHGIGFAIPRNWNSRCNPRFQRYLEVPSSDLDAVVLLTEVALENIKKRFGNINIFKCIPNKVDLNPVLCPVEKRNRNKTVCVGRFSEEKQFVQVVKAFAFVVKECPNAILELYGRGNDETAIKEEIEKNCLENNVFIRGFSRNVQEVFSDAILSVVSSEYTVESFCLSLVESLASGCPVVSYEMKFGAAYVIKDGYNGFLAKADDIEELAANIIKVYKLNDEELETFSKNAYETAQIFNEEEYEENWGNVIREIVEQREKKSFIEDIGVDILDIVCHGKENKIVLRGQLEVKGRIPQSANGLERIYVRSYTTDRNDYIVKAGSANKVGENRYAFEIETANICAPVSVCFECTNSFLEKDVTEDIRKALGL